MRNTVLGCPWSNTQLWIIKSSFYSVNCFPEMWNCMKGKQTKPNKAHMSMTLPVTQHMTWSRLYAFTRIRGSFARDHAITGPWGLSISVGFSGSSHSLMCFICSCTWPHRQSTLKAIRHCKNSAKNTPEGKTKALVDAICQCSHEGSHSFRLPFPPSLFASHCRCLWCSLKMHWPKVQVAQWTMLTISRDMTSFQSWVHEIGLQDEIRQSFMQKPHHTSRDYAIIMIYKNYYAIITKKIRQKLRWYHLRLQCIDESKYHNLTSTTTLIKRQWTCVCLSKQSLRLDVMPSLISLPFFSSQSDLTGMPGVSCRISHHVEEYYEYGGRTLSSSPSQPCQHSSKPPLSSRQDSRSTPTFCRKQLLSNDSCSCAAPERSTNIFVRNFSKRYLAKGICFYLDRRRQRLPATAVVLSIICKRKCLLSNDHHGHKIIHPEIHNLSLVWIRNFIEHAIKEKTTSEECRRFHPTCRMSWERENIFIWHLQVLRQFLVINCCWFPTTACDFHRLKTRAWTLYISGTWISSPLFSPAETSSFDM